MKGYTFCRIFQYPGYTRLVALFVEQTELAVLMGFVQPNGATNLANSRKAAYLRILI